MMQQFFGVTNLKVGRSERPESADDLAETAGRRSSRPACRRYPGHEGRMHQDTFLSRRGVFAYVP